MNVGIDAIIESQHDKLGNGFRGKIVGDFGSRAKAVWQMAPTFFARLRRRLGGSRRHLVNGMRRGLPSR